MAADQILVTTPEQIDKWPEFTKMKKALEEEKAKLLQQSAPHRSQREELLKKIQPLEAKLREVDDEIIKIERPRLGEIENQLGRLSVAMGGRAMNQPAAR